MTESEALAVVYERAAGACECIGGGCPSLSHRPGQNRCTASLRSAQAASYFANRRFADRSDPDNISVVCAACSESARRHGQRIEPPAAPAGAEPA